MNEGFESECKSRGLKVYRYGEGQAVGAKPDSCLFCKHCTDIFWDYTHGPYTLCCELDLFPDCIEVNGRATCSEFKEDK